MTKVKQLKQGRIDPRKQYNIQGMIEADAFPWLSEYSERHKRREYAELIAKDFLGSNMLGAVRIPQGQKTGYLIKGRCLKNFIQVYGPGLTLAKQRIWKQKRS